MHCRSNSPPATQTERIRPEARPAPVAPQLYDRLSAAGLLPRFGLHRQEPAAHQDGSSGRCVKRGRLLGSRGPKDGRIGRGGHGNRDPDGCRPRTLDRSSALCEARPAPRSPAAGNSRLTGPRGMCGLGLREGPAARWNATSAAEPPRAPLPRAHGRAGVKIADSARGEVCCQRRSGAPARGSAGEVMAGVENRRSFAAVPLELGDRQPDDPFAVGITALAQEGARHAVRPSQLPKDGEQLVVLATRLMTDIPCQRPTLKTSPSWGMPHALTSVDPRGVQSTSRTAGSGRGSGAAAQGRGPPLLPTFDREGGVGPRPGTEAAEAMTHTQARSA